jgi:hypothetical protein
MKNYTISITVSEHTFKKEVGSIKDFAYVAGFENFKKVLEKLLSTVPQDDSPLPKRRSKKTTIGLRKWASTLPRYDKEGRKEE